MFVGVVDVFVMVVVAGVAGVGVVDVDAYVIGWGCYCDWWYCRCDGCCGCGWD